MIPLLFAAGLGLSAAGTGFSLFGASKSAKASKEIAALEMKIESQRRTAMEIDARRKQMEIFRNQQRARSMALTTASAQGAQGGSGLAGAYGQVSGQTGVNLLGVNENLQIGRNIFGLNSQISQQRMNQADAGMYSALGGGLSSLGKDLFGSMDAFGRLSKGFGNPTPTASSTSWSLYSGNRMGFAAPWKRA